MAGRSPWQLHRRVAQGFPTNNAECRAWLSHASSVILGSSSRLHSSLFELLLKLPLLNRGIFGDFAEDLSAVGSSKSVGSTSNSGLDILTSSSIFGFFFPIISAETSTRVNTNPRRQIKWQWWSETLRRAAVARGLAPLCYPVTRLKAAAVKALPVRPAEVPARASGGAGSKLSNYAP